MSDLWKRELAELRAKIKELDDKCEELLAAGPIAPGIVEATAELAHEAAQLEQRLTATKSEQAPTAESGERGDEPH
ncbi:MAG TPA: hypothetical protein VFH38_09420 [Jatrophihabitans sp.]|nr:hypothetical protein [Jatrophihabitans sp.]